MKIIKPLLITASIFLFQTSFAGDDKHKAGEKLFNANCAACHGAAVGGMDMSKRIAPPITAVRMHYIETYPDEASFVQAVTSWVAKQDKSKSLMRGAIQHFKIMPPLVVAKQDAEKIAAYIYAGNIEKPEGFEQHVEEEHGKMGMEKGLHRQGKGQGKDMKGQGMHQMQGQGMRRMQGMGMQNQGQGMHQMQGMHNQHQRMNKMMGQANQGKGMMRRGGKRGMSAQMMQQLDLSPQQQQQMQTLIQEKESRIQPVKKELRQISQTIRQLDTTSPNFKSQIFSLADEKAKRVHRMVIEKGEMRMKIESVLNAEQRAQFKQMRQLRQQHRQNKQNH